MAGKGSKPGERRGGRQKGTPNKLTRSVKQAFEDAFVTMQDDPVTKLEAWGKANPTDFYKLAARLIPAEITGQGGGPLVVAYDPQETARRLLFLLTRGAVAGEKEVLGEVIPQKPKKLTVAA